MQLNGKWSISFSTKTHRKQDVTNFIKTYFFLGDNANFFTDDVTGMNPINQTRNQTSPYFYAMPVCYIGFSTLRFMCGVDESTTVNPVPFWSCYSHTPRTQMRRWIRQWLVLKWSWMHEVNIGQSLQLGVNMGVTGSQNTWPTQDYHLYINVIAFISRFYPNLDKNENC